VIGAVIGAAIGTSDWGEVLGAREELFLSLGKGGVLRDIELNRCSYVWHCGCGSCRQWRIQDLT